MTAVLTGCADDMAVGRGWMCPFKAFQIQSTGSIWTAEFIWATGASVTIQMICSFWHCQLLSLLLKGTHTAVTLQFHCFVFCNNILHGLCHVQSKQSYWQQISCHQAESHWTTNKVRQNKLTVSHMARRLPGEVWHSGAVALLGHS